MQSILIETIEFLIIMKSYENDNIISLKRIDIEISTHYSVIKIRFKVFLKSSYQLIKIIKKKD